jgi:hypothetical protein
MEELRSYSSTADEFLIYSSAALNPNQKYSETDYEYNINILSNKITLVGVVPLRFLYHDYHVW